MKIHLVGNVLNWGFLLGKFFHEKGHKVTVFIDRKETDCYLPRWEFPELGDTLPEWVEVVDVNWKKLFIGGRAERNFIKKLRDCDIIQTFGEAAIWARWSGTPYVLLSYGLDLDTFPFNARYKRWSFLEHFVKGNIFAYLVRDMLRKAGKVIYTMPQQRRAVEKLRLTNAEFFPCAIPVDTERYKPFSCDKKKELKAGYNSEYIFFHPVRQDWTFDNSINNKGNDKLYRAFARFIREKNKKALLITVEKGQDIEKSKKLIAQLGIEKYIRWLKPVDKKRLIEIFNASDICFDDFGYGYYGCTTLEALSIGVPTFLHCNQESGHHAMPPIINVFSEDEIYENMIKFADNREKFSEIGRRSREWIERHHSWEKVIDRYLNLYKEVLNAR